MVETHAREGVQMNSETFPEILTRHINELARVPVEALDNSLKDPEFVKAIDLLPNGVNLYYQIRCGFTVFPTTSVILHRLGKDPLVEQIRKGLFRTSS